MTEMFLAIASRKIEVTAARTHSKLSQASVLLGVSVRRATTPSASPPRRQTAHSPGPSLELFEIYFEETASHPIHATGSLAALCSVPVFDGAGRAPGPGPEQQSTWVRS